MDGEILAGGALVLTFALIVFTCSALTDFEHWMRTQKLGLLRLGLLKLGLLGHIDVLWCVVGKNRA